MDFNPQYLAELANCRMPFGKYEGRYLDELPEAYYVWFSNKGWPEGKIGLQLQSMYEVKVNGLEYLIKELRARGY